MHITAGLVLNLTEVCACSIAQGWGAAHATCMSGCIGQVWSCDGQQRHRAIVHAAAGEMACEWGRANLQLGLAAAGLFQVRSHLALQLLPRRAQTLQHHVYTWTLQLS